MELRTPMLENWTYRFMLPVVVLLVLVADFVYLIPITDSLKFGIAVFFLFYVPGDLFVRVSGLRIPFAGGRLIFSSAIGLVVVSIFYSMWRRMGIDGQYLGLVFFPVFCTWAGWLYFRNTAFKPEYMSKTDALGVLILIVTILPLLHFTHFTDVLFTDDGYRFRVSSTTETVFHFGLVNALVDSYPPSALYASGAVDFAYYHLGMHLHIDLIHRLTGIDSIKLVYYYFSFLYFFLLSTLCFSVVRLIGGSWLIAVVGGALIFGSDFSFVTGIANDIRAPAVWDLMFIPGPYSLFTNNGVIAGLISLLLAVIVFRQYVQEGSLPILLALVIIVYSAYLFKSSLGVHLTLAFIGVGILMIRFSSVRVIGMKLVFSFSVLMLAIVFVQLNYSIGIGNVVMQIAPFNLSLSLLERYGQGDTPVIFKVPLYVVFLVLGLGIRYLGYHVIINTKWNMKTADWSVTFIAIFMLFGYLISESVFIGVQGEYNNAIWFVVQSFFAAWVLVFFLLKKLESRRKKHVLASVAILVLAYPSTIQLVAARYDPNYVDFGPQEIAIIDYLRTTQPDSVILHPVNFTEPSLASNFAGRASVLNGHHSFVTQEDNIAGRYSDVTSFFDRDTKALERELILEKYGVNYVYCRNDEDVCARLPELSKMRLVFGNSEYSVFEPGT